MGVVATLAVILSTGQTIGGFGLGLSGRSSDRALARDLTGRLVQSFVGAERIDDEGRLRMVYFYDTPTPAGRNLCRVNRYAFVGKMVDGAPSQPENAGVEGLRVSVGYAVAPQGENAAERKNSCARYRDFSRLISVFPGLGLEGGERESLDRIVDLLRQAKAPGTVFTRTCRGRDGPCDLRKELAAIDLQRIEMASGGPVHNEEIDFSHTDQVAICRDAPPPCSQPMEFSLKSRFSPRELPSNQNHLISVDLDLAPITL